jgi:hypothetical protein
MSVIARDLTTWLRLIFDHSFSAITIGCDGLSCLKKPAGGPSRRFAATPHFVSLRGQRGLVTNDSNPTLLTPEQKSPLVARGRKRVVPQFEFGRFSMA